MNLFDMQPAPITAETIEEGAAIMRQQHKAYWQRVRDLQAGKIELTWDARQGYHYRYKDKGKNAPWSYWGHWL